MRDLVIGLDSSTTATKAIAWGRDGRAVAEGRASIPMSNPHPGWYEQDATDWWASTKAALADLFKAVDPACVAAIGISNQRETFAPFRNDGTPLRPGMLWLDERAKAEMHAFGESFGRERLHRISGKPSDITPGLPRFIWLQNHEPEIFASTERYADVHGYLAFRLTGNWATSTGSADPSGLFDMEAMDWSEEILSAIGLKREQFARAHRPGQILGEVSELATLETGLSLGTLVVAGGGDGQCAGLGTNTLMPGRAYINLGTAVVSGSYGRPYRYDPAFRTLSAIAESGYIYETCIRSGTLLVNWLTQELFGADTRGDPGFFSRLEREADEVGIGAGGVMLVPYWSSCMTPYWDASARGVMVGLSSSHKRGHLYRALLEGFSLEQAMMGEHLDKATGEPIEHFVAIGGGASSDLWCRILSDVTGRPVYRSATVEASSLGAAMAAAVGARWFDGFASAGSAMAGAMPTRFDPDPAAHARYRELLAVYSDLWPTLTAWNERLTAVMERRHV